MKALALALLLLLVAAPGWGQTVRELVELTDLSAVSISPDGRYAAFRTERASIERSDYTLEWRLVALDGNMPARTLAGAGEPIWRDAGVIVAEPPVWSPDSRWIYYRALIDGQIQVWRASIDGQVERLTSDQADVERFALSGDGKTLRYTAGAAREAIRRAEQAEYDSGIRIDATIDPAQNLFRAARINGRLASQRLAGRWFARTGLLWAAPKRTMIVNLSTLEARETPDSTQIVELAPPTPPNDAITATAVAEDGRAVHVLTARTGTQTLVLARSAACKSAEACRVATAAGERVAGIAWRPESDEVIFTVSDRRLAYALKAWNTQTGEIREIAREDGLISGGRDPDSHCAIGAAVAVCVVASPVTPPRLVRIDLDSATRFTLADPNRQLGLRRVHVEPLAWQDEAGRAFSGWLILPATRKAAPAPLFITYYLCEGFLRGGVGDEWPLAPLAESGIVALCINRLSLDSAPDATAHYDAALSGVRSVIALLAARGLIDPERVGMGGLSFGSEVTAWVAREPGLLAAISISSTLVEPAYYWMNGVAGRDNHAILKQVWRLGSPTETPQRWQEISPALNPGRYGMPILFQMPEQEFRLNIQFFSELSATGAPVEMYAFPNEPHIKTQPRHKLAVYQRNLDWFRFWLLGAVDPDPAKAEQYRRWNAFARQHAGGTAGTPSDRHKLRQD